MSQNRPLFGGLVMLNAHESDRKRPGTVRVSGGIPGTRFGVEICSENEESEERRTAGKGGSGVTKSIMCTGWLGLIG